MLPAVAALRPTGDPASDEVPGRVRLLFVGVPDPHKRPELAIEVLAELRRRGTDADLVFIGVHPARDRARLRDQVEAVGLGDDVQFLDRVYDAELAGRYATSVLLATSRTEGFGLPPVEAVLSGGRVAAVPSPAYRETLDGIVPFARDASAVALTDAVMSALESPPAAGAVAALAERFGPRAAAGSWLPRTTT